MLRRGWYAAAYAHPAVVEAVSAGGVCSCVTALGLHGVWVPRCGDRAHVRARPAAYRGKGAARFCRYYGRPHSEVYPVDDLITALRHALRCLDDEGVIVVCDSILNRYLLEAADLEAVFACAPLRIRRLLDRCDQRAESGTETIVRLRLQSLRLRSRVQVEIAGIGRVDLLVGRRLIIEVDSVEHHDRSPEQREKDRRRDEEAIRRGYLPLRLSYRRVMFQWDEVVHTLREITRRGDHLSEPVLAG